jgi:hypothetical protein
VSVFAVFKGVVVPHVYSGSPFNIIPKATTTTVSLGTKDPGLDIRVTGYWLCYRTTNDGVTTITAATTTTTSIAEWIATNLL